MKRLFSVIFLGALAWVSPLALAKPLETFQHWTAFEEMEGSNKVCFAASVPQKSAGAYAKRGSVNFLVSHRQAEGALNVVSFNAGYAFKEESEATLVIGASEFKLFTAGAAAWAYDAKADAAVVKAMRGGTTMTATGISSRGAPTTDTFSLGGFAAANDAINKACGVK